MDFLQLTRNWTNGEIKQAKFMIILGCFTTAISFFLIVSREEFHHGISIPIVLLSLIFIFYGSFVFRNRPHQLKTIIKNYKQGPLGTIETEKNRILKEKENYNKVRITWTLVFVIGLVSYFLAESVFYKGIALGAAIFGIAIFLVDSFLSIRINRFYVGIETILSKRTIDKT